MRKITDAADTAAHDDSKMQEAVVEARTSNRVPAKEEEKEGREEEGEELTLHFQACDCLWLH